MSESLGVGVREPIKFSTRWKNGVYVTYFIYVFLSIGIILEPGSVFQNLSQELQSIIVAWLVIFGPFAAIFVYVDGRKFDSLIRSYYNVSILRPGVLATIVWCAFPISFWAYFWKRRFATRNYPTLVQHEQVVKEEQVKAEQRVRYEQEARQREWAREEEQRRQQASQQTNENETDWAYDIFGLRSNVTKDQVKARYYELIKQYHPDKLGQATAAQRDLIEEKTKEINRAYEILQSAISAQESNSLFSGIVNTLEAFTPSYKWKNESGYQAELYSFLKQAFPQAIVEPQSGASRPDIAIENIAIEVKGPTGSADLNTLTTKCLKYSHYYRNLIIVLFEPRFSEQSFSEISQGIRRTFPNVEIIKKQ